MLQSNLAICGDPDRRAAIRPAHAALLWVAAGFLQLEWPGNKGIPCEDNKSVSAQSGKYWCQQVTAEVADTQKSGAPRPPVPGTLS